MRLGHSTPQPRRIVGKAMKAAEANPAAYVTRREVPSAWRTSATQPIGQTSAASTMRRDVGAGQHVGDAGQQAGRDPRVEAVGVEGRVGDREVAGLEEGLDAAEVVDGVGGVDELVGTPDGRQDRHEREHGPDRDGDDGVGPRPAEEATGGAELAGRAGRAARIRQPGDGHGQQPSRRRAAAGPSARRRAARRVAKTAMRPTETAGETASASRPRAPRARTTSQPGRNSTTERTTKAGIVSTQCAMRAIVSGRHDFSTTRVRTYDGGRSRVLVARDRNSRVFCRSAGPGRTTAVPTASRRGGVRQAPGVRSYAARRATSAT